MMWDELEQQSLNLPGYIVNGDNLSFGVDGTTLTGTFINDVATTFASIIAVSPIPGIVFTNSGLTDLIITSNNSWSTLSGESSFSNLWIFLLQPLPETRLLYTKKTLSLFRLILFLEIVSA